MKRTFLTTALAVLLGFSIGGARADMVIVTNGAATDTALAETQLAGGAGFPLSLTGYADPAQLFVAAAPSNAGWYRFTYYGAGNSADTNQFCVGANCFLAVGPGGTGVGSSTPYPQPNPSFFDVFLSAGQEVAFTLSNLTTGCTIASGTTGNPANQCSYLVALSDSTTGPNRVAYIGFADLPETGDLDHQDLVVRVEQIPEPATLALLGSGLLGLGLMRRRRAA